MLKLKSLLLGITFTDNQILSRSGTKSKSIIYASAIVLWYFITCASFVFYQFFSVSYSTWLAVILTFSFLLPCVFFYSGILLFTFPKRISLNNLNSVVSTRIIKYMFLSIVLYAASKSLDIFYLKYIVRTNFIDTKQILAQIIELNEENKWFVMVSILQVIFFFTPILFKRKLFREGEYISLIQEAEQAIILADHMKFNGIITSKNTELYQRYKGKKKYKPQFSQLDFSESRDDKYGHSTFLYDLRNKK